MASVYLEAPTAGTYIPPARLNSMQPNYLIDKFSEEYQRNAWESLKKTLKGLLNKINKSNFTIIANQLLSENISRGNGLFASAIIDAQDTSPELTDVFATVVSIVNDKIDYAVLLIVHRLNNNLKEAIINKDTIRIFTIGTFFAHLVNHGVINELLILQLIMSLLYHGKDNYIIMAVKLMKICGSKIQSISEDALNNVFQIFYDLLRERILSNEVKIIIEILIQLKLNKFEGFPPIERRLLLVYSYFIEKHGFLGHNFSNNINFMDKDEDLNVFKYTDAITYQNSNNEHKKLWFKIPLEDVEGEIKNEEGILEPIENTVEMIDYDHVTQEYLPKCLYITIKSNLKPESACLNLLKIRLGPGLYYKMANLILDYGAQLNSYKRIGEIAVFMCRDRPEYVTEFDKLFREKYSTIHRMNLTKNLNIGYFFANLFVTGSISWDVLSEVHLREDRTTASGRLFLTNFFTEMCKLIDTNLFYKKVTEDKIRAFFKNIFTRDNFYDTAFVFNFFNNINLKPFTNLLLEMANEIGVEIDSQPPKKFKITEN